MKYELRHTKYDIRVAKYELRIVFSMDFPHFAAKTTLCLIRPNGTPEFSQCGTITKIDPFTISQISTLHKRRKHAIYNTHHAWRAGKPSRRPLNGRQCAIIDCRFSLVDTEAGRRNYLAGHSRCHLCHLDEDLSGPFVVGKPGGTHCPRSKNSHKPSQTGALTTACKS